MKAVTWFLSSLIIIWATTFSTSAQNTPLSVEPILIYQSGRVFSIDPQTAETKDIAQFSTDFMLEPNSTAVWAKYDKSHNRIYMLAGRQPWDPKKGKQLSSVVALDLETSKVDILYTDYYLLNGEISPQGTKLLIHHYKVGNYSFMPMASQVCILLISKNLCQYRDLKGITNHFVWLNELSFATPLLGILYICDADKINCNSQSGLENVYVDRVSKTALPNQLLIAGQLHLYDGTVHYFYYDVITHKQTEIEQLRETPVYNSDHLAVIQDVMGYMSLSSNGNYLIVTNELTQGAFSVLDLSAGTRSEVYKGTSPQWIEDSNLFVDISLEQGSQEVYSFDVVTGKRTALYTTSQPFNLILP